MSTVTHGVRIDQITPADLSIYASIPIAFEVRSVLEVEPIDHGLGGIHLTERTVPEPYIKDYDGQEEGGSERWPDRFDLDRWALFLALESDRSVGGAAVALDTPDISGFSNCPEVAGLWDIRVHPDFRRRGVGAALFDRVVDTARRHGCPRLKIETQNINLPACRFYAAQGCTLGGFDIHAYGSDPTCAHETMLLWYFDLQEKK